MNVIACSLDAAGLREQLERYRAIGRLAARVEREPGRVVVRFADDPPSALIERTIELERGCCPFFEIDYEPAAQRLAIGVDGPDRRPGLDTIEHALTESPATGLVRGTETGQLRTVPGSMSCCSPAVLEACCEPEDKQSCCGHTMRGETAVTSPSRCGCDV